MEIGSGFWVSIKAFLVEPSDGRPNGINYTLTLHRPGGHRILGYDNAHAPPAGSGPAQRSVRQGRSWDHRHWRETTQFYEFASPAKLLEEFWDDVKALLKEEGEPWTE